MKKITLSLVMIAIAISLLAQSPQAFKYQAVARNSSGVLLSNQNVSFQISILEGSTTGLAVYSETFDTITNEFGLVNLEIGNGSVVSGLFADIDWGDTTYFLQVEMDEDGGINYQLIGTSQLLSVPYSLYSESTGDTTRWKKNNGDLYYIMGNVGIGTSAPVVNFDIRSTSTGSTSKLLLGNADNSTNLFFNSGHESANPYISFQGMNALRFMRYDGGLNELMRITSDGTVGIGTDDPDPFMKLDIRGNEPDDGALINLSNSDNTHMLKFFGGRENDPNPFIMWKEGDPLRFSTDEGGWSEKMRITNSGRVGIGTDSPNESALLDINSNSKGFLLPRMTSGEISNIHNPADGLQVYNTDDSKLYIFISSDSTWKEVSFGSGIIPLPASYIIGSGSMCNNTVVHGYYQVDSILTINNNISIEVDVISTGFYSITTDIVNGYSFTVNGIFVSTGIQTVNLVGSGTPIAIQTDIFTSTASNGDGTCTFFVPVEEEYQCTGSIIDNRDGQTYNIVLIGTQCWMAENLNVGLRIDGFYQQLDNDTIEKCCYNDSEDSCSNYGGIYMWDEMMKYVTTEGVEGICPSGWHIPTDEEWKELEGYVDSEYGYPHAIWDAGGWRGSDAGYNLKATSGWNSYGNGSDLFGFAALGCGMGAYPEGYDGLTLEGWYWTSTSSGSFEYLRKLSYFYFEIYRDFIPHNEFAAYVRCIHD